MRHGAGKKTLRTLVAVAVMMAVLAFWSGCDPSVPYQEPQPGLVTRFDFTSSADGLRLPCSVYLPAGYDPAKTYPVWFELHALYGHPILTNDPNNPFSTELRTIANQRGWIILAPWGRNLHSMFMDGMVKDKPPYYEPKIYDDFSSGAGSWQPLNGSWQVSGGAYRQSDGGASWKQAARTDSRGENYAVRVKVRDLTPAGTESAMGVNLRLQDNGDCYHVDLCRKANGAKSIRFYKVEGGTWTLLYELQNDWNPLPGENWINLKFSCYENYLEVYVNEWLLNMQPGYDATPYGYGRFVPGSPLPPGKVSLCSYGGVHEFDEVRIQNEYEYGERDLLDCLYGAMEKYRIDPTRIYVAGHSQGGLGAYVMGLHNPDLCAAMRPAGGFSDLYYDYLWLKEHYPRNPGPPFADVNDGQLTDYLRTIPGGEASPAYPERMSILNGNSARYILENAVNNHWRIVHGTPDANVPNSYQPVGIAWWAPWWFFWAQVGAPSPYSPATATYANGKDIADLLASWASPGRYSSEYITNPFVGHGFLETYTATADGLQGKVLSRRPAEVAYKTYDGVNDGAWWLRLRIPRPGMNEPGMARVIANPAANSAAIHARNLSRLELDLEWMGLDCGAGKTLTFNLDDNTAPNVFPITDTTGAFALELKGRWTKPSGLTVKLDGATLAPGTHYTVSGLSLLVNDVPAAGGHTLTVQMPATLPDNLAPNPGAETDGGGGAPANWTGEVQGGGSASFLWDDLQMHGGGRSLRIKDANLAAAGSKPVWKSSAIAVTPGTTYLLGAFAKARMLRGGAPAMGIAWYDGSDNLVGTSWAELPGTSEYALNLDWTPLALSGKAPAGSAYARILAGIGGASAGQNAGSAWFDDLSFTAL